jgi:cyclic pyranopterin monophosphate synthase
MAKKGTARLSHVGADGRARMVDVGGKPVTERVAVAEAYVRISQELGAAISGNQLAKGNLLEVARLAGIQAAKRTPELIPLCHALPLDHADVRIELEAERIRIVAEARTHARTGVEMEALTAATVAALTVIDMGKAIDKGMVIEGVRVLEKRGGRSGTYRAPGANGATR